MDANVSCCQLTRYKSTCANPSSGDSAAEAAVRLPGSVAALRRCTGSGFGQCQGRLSPRVLVQVHFLDPYKHFQPFLLAPIHDWDLYKHSDLLG